VCGLLAVLPRMDVAKGWLFAPPGGNALGVNTTRKNNYELVSKAKIELHLFQQYFTPHTPPLKQCDSETTLSPDLSSTRIIRSTVPFRKCFKSCSLVSDLVTRYGPQATTRFTCLVLVPFEHEPSKSECR